MWPADTRPSAAALPGEGGSGLLHVDFPEITSALLANLNQQRVEGKLCDISIHVQGRVFRAHRAVLAASSPYFHDQVLLKNMTSIVLPNVMDPSAFETVLGSAYTGRLSMAPEEIVNFLTVGSVLQMWHIVDKCTELLKEGRVAVGLSSDNQSPSSSNYFSPRETPEEPPRAPQPRDGAASKSSADALEPEEEEEEEEEPTRRPLYVRPSIVPHKQWVYVKQEWLQEDLVLTCEEDEDPLPPRPPKTEEEEDEQVDFCESSEDFPSPYGGLEEPPEPPSLPPRPLLPMDMQGNQILVFPPQSAAEHGAVRLTAAPDGNKIFMCHCGKAFSHKSMRDRHVNMHLNLRPFACPVCSKKFKMKHHLTEHMKTHTGLKPYQCDVCAKKFMWRDSFVRHKGHSRSHPMWTSE
uniref:Zinc finger and BTB domain-containing protein 22 n=1 Tax=Pavo cristatus TaxID=9049 RepID=A0A8C9FUN9_PAVCR